MAKAKVIPPDISSREFDELRRLCHTILHLLETLNTTVVTDAGTLLAAAQAIGDAVKNGVTVAALGTREVAGVLPKVQQHAAPLAVTALQTLQTASKNY